MGTLLRLVALAGLVALLAGCAGSLGGQVKAYPGPDRPASEVSVVKCGFSLAMVAIDENTSYSGEPLTCHFAVMPGRHAFRVRIVKKEYGTPISYIQQGDQVVEYELRAGQTYNLNALEDSKAKGLWTISITDPVTNKIVTLRQVRLQ
jgi:hypothetical protein